ncbi:MAG: ATPase domain-containing protein [Candidatus Geothermarchaeales archaeon]
MDRMPSELIEFFSRGNNTLLVKGEPGTGKTILSLELLRRFSEEMNGIYLSTRVSPDRLLNQFPWLRDVVKSEHILETGKAGVEGGFRVSDSTIREFPTVLEHFYELAIGIENPFIVVDSWYAIADELEPEQIRTTMKILETLVASKNANLVFVSETPGESGLDYTVDGVVTLSAETLEDRRLRVIHLNKLRGVEIRHNAYLFTLKDGRFQHFPSFTRKYPEQPETYEPLPDSETHFSTGIEGLDRVLGGGYPRGSIVQMEIGGNVQTPEFEAFLLATARNFTLQGRGVLFVPCCGLDADYVFKLMERFGVGEKERLGLIKIFERDFLFKRGEALHRASRSYQVFDGELPEVRGGWRHADGEDQSARLGDSWKRYDSVFMG